ncbi:tripartite tricarboxylate transporter permease [Desulfosporosinus sp. SB140]|uniref:tripartite tricarboxylate transporter permease n=1 Tax=Desulfosporosinus paludis TaxID=3115649 RepID=UPI00388E0E66
MEHFLSSLPLLSDPQVMLYMVIGVLAGFVIGVLPGLTDPMALALCIPLTFYMQPLPAILFLMGIHMACLYGGSITAIMLNTPGKPAAAATAIDGYPLTKKGQSRKALQMSAVSCLVGSTISVLALIIFAPLLGRVALEFGPSEYFAVGIFGISVVAVVAGKSLPKAFAAAALGILISTIGADPLFGIPRFTFGNLNLLSGIDIVPALTGLFAVSEIFIQISRKSHGTKKLDLHLEGEGLTLGEFRKSLKTMIKSGIIGVLVGSHPGTGGVLSSFLSYNEAVRSSKNPEKYGKGELDGIAAAECGAAGTDSASLIPLLTFGVPGDMSSAILLGAFILHGIRVGPDVFTNFGNVIYAMFIGIIILEILVFVLGWYGSTFIAKIVHIPRHFLFAVITVLVVTGSFSLNNSFYDVWITLVFGLLGLIMRHRDYPLPALLMGLVLGPIIEKNFSLAMSSTGGNPIQFLIRPITLIILALAVIMMYLSVKVQRQMRKATINQLG